MMKATLPERVKGVCCPPSITVPPARIDASVEVLKALADPTRLQMVGVLKRSTKLRDAGLVDVTKVGIWAYYRLAGHLEPKTRALLDVLV